ncbi:MAG TPA: putative glycolipid-binding domain-containing protein [Actinomycetes bacterium]|jgi:hypothetical protein|nr:putative glycolipid-binding domain-containing protein [Actinomycetes bacterium]
MRQRAVAWAKDDDAGVELVEVTLDERALSASGVAIGGEPVAYRLDYALETGPGFVTTRLEVTARGEGWRRTLDLRRGASGEWTASASTDGDPPAALDPPGAGGAGRDGSPHRLPGLDGALDCDLGLSPLTNSMPVLRHRLLEREGSIDFLMAWVSVPDLGVQHSRQRYTAPRSLAGGNRLIHFESLDSTFTADLSFDRDGLVIDYPGIGHRLG